MHTNSNQLVAVNSFDEHLIAPCGMNCGVCSSYLAMTLELRAKGFRLPYCAGCRVRQKQCALLKKRCPLLAQNQIAFCFECDRFACRGLQAIDLRYRTLYRTSLVANLKAIQRDGLPSFLQNARHQSACPVCGGVICCHNHLCYQCDLEKLRAKSKIYRWDEE